MDDHAFYGWNEDGWLYRHEVMHELAQHMFDITMQTGYRGPIGD
jgi:hypothetical protein